MGKSHVSAVKPLLTYSPFLVSLVNYHIKTFCCYLGQLLLGSGVWQDCEPLPTRTLHQQNLTSCGKGGKQFHSPIPPFFPSTCRDGRSFLLKHRLGLFIILLTHRLGLFIIFLTQQVGEPFSAIHDFPVNEPFTISAMGVCFHTDLVVCVYVFPAHAESLITSSIPGCVFPVVSMLRLGLLFSP